MLWPNNENVIAEYRKERLHRATYERFIRRVCGTPDRRNRFYYRTLSWLGRCLIFWGTGLQNRYTQVVDTANKGAMIKELTSAPSDN
ncbi:MAG: hypothetical protein PVF74_00935 [Anaerolineales bacterium]|jgi:hypothetical protein